MGDKAQFEIMRFQIMSFALSEAGKRKIGDAYLFAWERKIWPHFDDGAEWHLPFEQHFKVSGEEVSELFNYLCDLWDTKKAPTFYEIEDHYDIRSGRTGWDRAKLMSVFRYLYLNENFDTDFWNKVVEPMKHPTEARSIVRKFDRDEDLYFN